VLRNYLVTALRNMHRNLGCTVIAIAGLAVSFSTALLISLYVRDELSYDRWIPGYASVYRVALGLEFGNFHEPPSAGTDARVAGWLKADLPQISAVGRLQAETRTLHHGDVIGKETVYWADPEIFDVLPLPTLAGELRNALESPDGLVLTRRMARKYFGQNNPIGQIIEMDQLTPFRVTAVLADLPSPTHLDTEIFASAKSAVSSLPDVSTQPRLNLGFDALTRSLTYIRLKEGADHAAVEAALPQLVSRHFTIPKGPMGKPLVPAPTVLMQSLPRIHFVPAGLHAMKPSGSIGNVYALSLVGVLILLIASFNFVNIVTARAARRAVEVGVRKAMGATRRDLIIQFLGESLLMVVVSAVIAVALTDVLLPKFNALLSRDIVFALWQDPILLGSIVLATVALGTVGGFYPAFVLSSFRSAAVLRGGPIQPGGRSAVRTTLVCLQFAVLIGLVVATEVIYRQTIFATNNSLRFDRDQILIIDTHCANAFPDEVRALPGVRSAACSDAIFGIGGGFAGTSTQPDGSRPTASTFVAADWNLLELYGLRPIAGHFFEADHPGDAMTRGSGIGAAALVGVGGAVVINETAVTELGFRSPQDAIGQPAPINGTQNSPPTIIGVVRDFELQGIRHEIQPTYFRVIPGEYKFLLVKLDGRSVSQTLAAIDRLWSRLGDGDPINRRFLDDAIQALYVDILREAAVFMVFSMIAVLIAALGMFSLSTYTVECRTKEIGIRKAMGASPNDIVQSFIWQLCKPVLWASLIAWPVVAVVMSRWLSGFYYHIAVEWWL
jgi:putative ABC transport system permease protein